MQIKAIKENYHAEIALIILCLRQYLNTCNEDALPQFIQDNKIDWKKVYQLSSIHRIRPVVYSSLLPFKALASPEDMASFRNYAMYLNAFALKNKRELIRILNVLKQNNIPCKPFKGIDLAEKIYGNIGLREFSDNDIIIHANDMKILIELMIREGYHSKDNQLYKRFPNEYIRDYKDIIFEKKTGESRDFAFEFHFKPTRYFQGYPYSFKDILGDDYLLESKKYDAKDHLKLMTLNSGLMDLYADLRSVLDIAVLLKKNTYGVVKDMDPVLAGYLNMGKKISSELFDYPSGTVLPGKNEKKWVDYFVSEILKMKAGKRIPVLKHMHFNLQNAGSVKRKAMILKNSLQLIVRPNLDDITAIKLPFYALYYFTKPLRIFLKSLRGFKNLKFW